MWLFRGVRGIRMVNKIDKKTIIIIVLSCLLFLAGWALFGSRSTISNNGSRVDAIRDDISRIEQQQQRTIERIESVENELTNSAERLDEISGRIRETERNIDSVTSSIEQSAERVTSDQGRIAEGQRILERIRKRCQEKTE